MNAVFENIHARASVRSFSAVPVVRAALEKIADAGVSAPTGMNWQTRRIWVVTDKALMSRLAKAVGAAIGRADYGFYGAPAFFLVTDEAQETNALANCACALENMMLASTALGLGSVWINQFRDVCDDAGVRGLLDEMGVPATQFVGGCLAVGHAAAPAKPVERKADLVRWFE